MTTYKLNDDIIIVCEWKNTRNGFKHEATLIQNGREIATAKATYLNRTWESYEYQTVMKKLVDVLDAEKTLPLSLRYLLSQKVKHQFREENNEKVAREFGAIGAIAMMGDLLTTNKKESNDWKARMLKAGLTGLQMPEDWDSLDEDTKATRLDGVINELTTK